MDISVLGPVEVRAAGQSVAIAPGKPRALLALLALHEGSTLSTDRLVAGLWGEEPPATAVKMVQLCVSQLRKALPDGAGGAEIVTRGHGYELRLRGGELDVRRFEQLIADGGPREALALWRGAPLADVADEPFAVIEIRRLEDLRLTAIELAVDRDLAAGRHREIVSELEALVTEDPLRERLHAQLMLALYRSGRQADALEAYRRARTALVEAIGVEPGPELRRLQEAVLRQDPSLEAPVADHAPTRVLDHAAIAEAARRVDAAADRTATERAGLRAAEDELAGDIVALQAARERADAGQRDVDGAVVCPFKGLASFEPDDAAFFFGRERLVAEMVARLAGAPLMGIVGPSGSGKSSALKAGLLPALAEGVLPGSAGWALALMRPGEHPLRALEGATRAAAPRGRLVLAVDQFEELFTACRDEQERAAFADALVAAARDPHRRALVILALRADFYGRCAPYPELYRLLGANQVTVGPMRGEELRRAIELPARPAGLQVDAELTSALIADVEGEPGGLPLLSTALLELWQRRDGRRLRMTTYEDTGGVRGAVARLAESAYQRLDDDQRRTARTILLRLAGEGEAVVRARVSLDEFGEDARPVLSELTDSRLLTVSQGEVEVAHEALLREWPRLRGWLEDDAEGRRLRRHLRAAARDWDAGGRDAAELYRGSRLASALDWAGDHDRELNALEHAFLDASRTAAGRAQRRLRMVLAVVGGLLVLAVVAGFVALDQRGNARDQAVAAEAQRLGAQALAEDDLDRSLLLARQGTALDDSLQTRGNLLATLLKSPATIGVMRGDGDRLISEDLSADERRLAFIDNDGTLSIVDPASRRSLTRSVTVPGHAGCIIDSLLRLDHLRFSPDGSSLAVGGCEPVVLDARTLRVVARPQLGHDRFGRFMYAAHFSPDGNTLFSAIALPPDRGTVIQRFDTRTGRRLDPVLGFDHRPELTTLMLTRDGRRVVTTDVAGPTVIRDARTMKPLQRWPVGAEYAALSPDGRTMLAGGPDGSVRFLDLVTGQVRTASGRHDRAVDRAVFSADGRFAITAGEDRRIIIWDVKQAAAGETLGGHAGRITGLAITRDSSTLYSAGQDSKILISDLGGRRRLGRPFRVAPENPGELPRYAMSADGRTLAVGRRDGKIALIDAGTLETISVFPLVPNGPVMGMSFVPGDRLLAVGGADGFLALVDVRRGTIVKRLHGHRAHARTGNNYGVFTPSVDAAGRLMATASDDNTVRLWALPSGRPLGPPLRFPRGVGDVSISPDGRTLAVAGVEDVRNPGVEIIDVATHRHRAFLSNDESLWDLARFTPDGRFLVGGSWKGWARLWSTKTWKPATRAFTGHAGAVLWQSMSRDGQTLATGSADGTVRLWDLRTQQPLGTALPGLPNRNVVPQFSPDGAYLFAIYDTGRAYRWDVRPSSWARHACEVAGRPLSRSEWQDALPGREYTPACAA
jgi:WD40 repeat protein/DNA-binding SARP family transcriptional activator